MNESNIDLIKINFNNNSKYIELNIKSFDYLEDLKRHILNEMGIFIHPDKVFIKNKNGKLITHYNYKSLNLG